MLKPLCADDDSGKAKKQLRCPGLTNARLTAVSYTHLDVYKRQHYGAYAPLGYVKDPDKKGHLLIDPETRWIVEKIFDLSLIHI